MADSLVGRVALITGASHGIGVAIARLFAAEGAAVAVHGRDAAAVTALADELGASGAQAMGVVGDLRGAGEAERIVAETQSQLGPIDVLIANAGASTVPPKPIEAIGVEGFQDVLDANLTITYATIAAVLPGMRDRGRGSIVTMSSAAARRPTVQSPAAYAAAKAGIDVLTRMVALQAGPDGIRANCIAPETIMTEKNAQRIPAEVQQGLVLAHPVRRLGSVDDVARAALYLAGDGAGWISGVTLDVAGGAVLA